jgi:hypothetical protein
MDQTNPARSTFGVVVVTPNLNGTVHVLLVEGINMAGNAAAADICLTSNIGVNAPRLRIVSQRILGDEPGR